MIGEPPSKSPSSQVKLNAVVVVKELLLAKFCGASGIVADTASPPTGEAGPSPTELKAITLTRTAAPYSSSNGGPYKVDIGIIQLPLAITD